MEPIVKMLEDSKQITRILKYCRRHAVPFSARCEELISIELGLTLMGLAWVPVPSNGAFGQTGGRERCLLMKVHASSYDLHLPWPSHNFTFSFQYRTVGHSFHSDILRYVHRNHIAVFAAPSGIYEHRLRENLRIAIDPSDQVGLVMDRVRMEVINLTMDGVAVAVPGPILLRIGQALPRLELVIGNERFSGKGKVRHISKRSQDNFLCGVSMEYDSPAALHRVQKLIVKKQLQIAGVGVEYDSPPGNGSFPAL